MRWRCVICFDESETQDGWTALICAADQGRADCVRLLIDAGADKEAADNVRRLLLLCWDAAHVFVISYRTIHLHVFFIHLAVFIF